MRRQDIFQNFKILFEIISKAFIVAHEVPMKQKIPNLSVAKFHKFLETEVFCEPVIDIEEISCGGSSYNFFCQTPANSYVIKLLNKKDNARMARIHKILQTFEQNPDFHACALAKTINSYFFYMDFAVLVMLKISGFEIRYKDFNKTLLLSVIKNYRQFLKVKFDNTDIIYPLRAPEFFYKRIDNKINELQKSNLGIFRTYLVSIISNLCRKIYDNVPKINSEQIIIHGDASLNNMIMQRNGCIAFLDFEQLRYGYAIEDISQLLLSSLLQHQVLGFPKRQIKELIEVANRHCKFKKSEWIYGIHLYFLGLAYRRLMGPKFLKSLRKDILFVIHLKKYNKISALINEIYDHK